MGDDGFERATKLRWDGNGEDEKGEGYWGEKKRTRAGREEAYEGSVCSVCLGVAAGLGSWQGYIRRARTGDDEGEIGGRTSQSQRERPG